MSSTSMNISVRGMVSQGPDGPLLVLSQRLDGHDTFLTGSLKVGEASIVVRILTLDDVTVLRPTDSAGAPVGTHWHGTLHLPHGLRPRTVPPDLQQAAIREERSLERLDEVELRYALTFLSESTTIAIRRARVDAIVSALPTNTRSPQ
ncbi:hypothetical protein SAMN05216215_101837 [Saccharopolyspora shandongensis]|uniref:Uncharacterized protein n=1 Tax=Saccharopolyspora shandongensis TaxID=418495 RepID=A0A1H3G404_9PSEU|nr:hypothetical protein [Saccharopolyspora shandongensis]SDX97981.1 hypothetical protein SAMN05216215_101837 [Saccharopolyspora shandongensis]